MSGAVPAVAPKMAPSSSAGDHMRLYVDPVRIQSGFTLVAVLAALFFLALGTQKVMTVVSHQVQREREAELLRIGAAYASAIGAYYELSPGNVKRWPPSLEALVDDRRFVTLQRHLRKLYADPITRSSDWGVVAAPDGGVAGVYSRSELTPIRVAGDQLEALGISDAKRYSDWKFVYKPVATVAQ